MARPRKARVEGAEAPKRPSNGFRATIEAFKADYPDKWEEIRLCPLQHGIEAIAETLEKA